MITMSSFKYAGLIISIIISLISCTHNKNYPTAFQPELAKGRSNDVQISRQRTAYITGHTT